MSGDESEALILELTDSDMKRRRALRAGAKSHDKQAADIAKRGREGK